MTTKDTNILCSLEIKFVGNESDNFSRALAKHMALHDGVTVFDLLKFLFQSSLGSFHLLDTMSETEISDWIRKNLRNTEPSDGPVTEDLYGKKWVRLNFASFKKKYGDDYQRIYRAFIMAKEMEREQPTEFRELIGMLRDLFRKGRMRPVADKPEAVGMILNFLKEYEEEGCPMIHHSKSYMAKNGSDYVVVPRSSLVRFDLPKVKL